MEETIRYTQNDTLKREYGKFLGLCAMGVVASTIGMVFDTVIAGNALGEEAVEAISLAGPIYLISTMLYMIFSVGGSTTCSQMIGAGRMDMTSVLFSLTLGVGMVVSFLIIFTGLTGSGRLAAALGGADPKMISFTSAYIDGLLLSIPFMLLCHVTMSFASIDGSPNLAFLSTVVTAVTKLIVDVLFVQCGLGIFGIALSTGVSFFFGFLVLLIHFKKDYCTLRIVNFFPHFTVLGRILLTGLPNALSFFWQAVHGVIRNKVLLGLAGTAALAGTSVSGNVSQLLLVVGMSFGYTLTPVLSLFYGEQDERAMSDVFRLAMKWGTIVSAAVAVLIAVFADKFAAFFGIHDSVALEIAYFATLMMALNFVLSTILHNFLYTFQSIQHTGLANFIVFSRSILFSLPCLYAGAYFGGIKGALAAPVVSDLLCVIGVYGFIYLKQHHNPFKLPNFFMLPRAFMEIHVYADVSVFYTQQSLAIFKEELAKRVEPEIVRKVIAACGNVIKYQLKETHGKSMDVFITRKGDYGSIKIRYQGAPYNAAAEISDAQFRYTLGLNTVTIRLLNS